MKKSLLLSLICICFLGPCFAADLYIGIFGGGSGGFDLKKSKLDTSMGYYLGGRIGLKCLSLLKVEEELSYQRSGVHSLEKKGIRLHHVKGHVSFWSLMTNLLIDFDCPFIISPYFGGGMGLLHGEGIGKVSSYYQNDQAKQKFHRNEFAWQLIVGLKSFICLGLEAGFEYRYFKLAEGKANHKLGLALTKFF